MEEIYIIFKEIFDKKSKRHAWPVSFFETLKVKAPSDFYIGWSDFSILFKCYNLILIDYDVAPLNNHEWHYLLSLKDKEQNSIFRNNSLTGVSYDALPWTDFKTDLAFFDLLYENDERAHVVSGLYTFNQKLNNKPTYQRSSLILQDILKSYNVFNLYKLINSRLDLKSSLPKVLQRVMDIVDNLHDHDVYTLVTKMNCDINRWNIASIFGLKAPAVSDFDKVSDYRIQKAEYESNVQKYRNKLSKFNIHVHINLDKYSELIATELNQNNQNIRRFIRGFNRADVVTSEETLNLIALACLHNEKFSVRDKLLVPLLSTNKNSYVSNYQHIEIILRKLESENLLDLSNPTYLPVLQTLSKFNLPKRLQEWFSNHYNNLSPDKQTSLINMIVEDVLDVYRKSPTRYVSIEHGLHLISVLSLSLSEELREQIIFKLVDHNFEENNIETSTHSILVDLFNIENEDSDTDLYEINELYKFIIQFLPKYQSELTICLDNQLDIRSALVLLTTNRNNLNIESIDLPMLF